MNTINPDSVSAQAAIAAKEPTKFDASERTTFIREHITHIVRMVKANYSIDDIKGSFPEFCEQYPSLLEMITRPSGYDEKSLSMMVTLLDRMGKGSSTQHEASIKVGQHLLDAYVKPQLDGQL